MVQVSVIIPAFNARQYLSEALGSLCQQTMGDFEVIVVDDGSTDGTSLIAQQFPDARIRVFVRENGGQSAASNFGCSVAKGRYIKFLDADDLLNPQHLESQLNALVMYPHHVSCCAWGYFRKTTSAVSVRSEVANADYDQPLNWIVDSLTSDEGMVGAWRWLIPRNIWDACGGWNEQLSLNNDFDLSIRILLASKGVRFAEGSIYYYRKGVPGAVSCSLSRHSLESAYLATLLGTRSLLQCEDSPRIRRLCADRFQWWVYRFFPKHAALVRDAEEQIRQLGGSEVKMQGGLFLQQLLPLLGWRNVRRLQAIAEKLGWQHVQRWKQRRRQRRMQ
jgi:glycosyltransferase involved in cell wall biosynthesis